MIRSILLLSALFFLSERSTAQLAGKIFGISSPALGEFRFSSVDPATNAVTDLRPMPLTGLVSTYSATADVAAGIYYFCDGASLYALDAYNAIAPAEVLSVGPDRSLRNCSLLLRKPVQAHCPWSSWT